MWVNKEVKMLAKKNLRSAYWMMVIVCLILLFIGAINSAGGDLYNAPNVNTETATSDVQKGSTQTPAIVDYFLEKLAGDQKEAKTTAVAIINSYKGTGGFLYGLFLKIDKLILSGSVAGSIIVVISIAVFVVYFMFLLNILYVGFCRMMMELRVYKGTKGTRVLEIFKRKGFINTAVVMLVVTLVLALYLLIAVAPLLAGGAVVAAVDADVIWPFPVGLVLSLGGAFLFAYKYLGYFPVSYILAVNTEVKTREALKLSSEMMKGNRLHFFGFLLTYTGWDILNICTFGLLGVFYVTPYKYLARTEIFMKLREEAIRNNLSYSYYLEDDFLTDPPGGMDAYPQLVPQKENRLAKYVADMNPTRQYSVVNLLLMFFIFSFVGKSWEVILHLVKDGEFVNRGTMYGPWLPIYGAAGVLIIVALRRLAPKPALLFPVIMVLCGVMEYATHWFIQRTMGIQYWNYSNYFLNINGRVALEGLLVFAILGTFFIYIGAPFVDNVLNKFSTKSKIITVSVLAVLFIIDKVYSHYHPKTGKGITDYKLKSKMSELPDSSMMFDPDFNPVLRIFEHKI